MSLGERASLRISAACGYGAQGAPPAIPPNADLIFDVTLHAINGQGESKNAAPAAVVLPTCRPHSCGMGMAANGNPTVAVCACDASCLAPGSALPCCQSFKEVCQAPQAPAPQPPAPQAPPQNIPPHQPFPPPQQSVAPAPSNLPPCTPSDCGHAISDDGSDSGTPVCMCSPLCIYWSGESGILPCCPMLQKVCLDPFRSPSPPSPAPTPQAIPPPQAFARLPQANAPVPQASLREADAAQNGGTQSSAPVPQMAAQRLPSSASPACTLGMSNWAEQQTCSKKRWAIRGGQCQKVCPSTDPQVGIKYYPKGNNGKAACDAALKLCQHG